MYRIVAIFTLLFVWDINAFQGSIPVRHGLNKAVVSSTARFIVLSDAETKKILSTAEECAEGECSVDDVVGLIDELKDQQREMERRLEKIMNMVAALQQLNDKGVDRDENEVRAFVNDLLRVFSHGETKKKVAVKPMGFPGSVGSATAYDALPPKKWKPSPNAKP